MDDGSVTQVTVYVTVPVPADQVDKKPDNSFIGKIERKLENSAVGKFAVANPVVSVIIGVLLILILTCVIILIVRAIKSKRRKKRKSRPFKGELKL